MNKNDLKPEDYLYSLNRQGVKLGLDKIKSFLSNFNDPQYDFDSVLIAGTNGKGSVTSMLSNILFESGYRTGRYISPHLDHFEERICIDGKNIPEDELWDLIEEIRPFLEKIEKDNPELRPSFFEVLTTIAYLYFSRKDVDVAVLEVGMGGRLDATNVSDHFISAVTTIGYDHMKYLGSTKREIAFEKAGIIRQGNHFVTGVKEDDIKEYLRDVCTERGAHYHHAHEREYEILTEPLRLKMPGYGTFRVPGIARWQAENALVTIGLVEGLRERGYEISHEDMKRGLEKTHLKGRMELYSETPKIIFDSAHNISGIEALSEGLKGMEYERLLLVIGILEDKDHKAMSRVMGSISDMVFTAEPVSERKLDSRVLAKEFEGHCPVNSYKHGIDALEAAKEEWREGDLIVVTGSIYLLGDIRNKIGGDPDG